MPRRKYTPEQIISKLREAEVLLSKGQTVGQACKSLGVSERRACRVLAQPRSTQRCTRYRAGDEAVLTEHIVELASQYGRYGYRRITALLRNQGWSVNHKRVERIWRKEGLKVPAKQPKRSRLWLNDGSCIRLLRSTRTMFGAMTSCRIEHRTATHSGS